MIYQWFSKKATNDGDYKARYLAKIPISEERFIISCQDNHIMQTNFRDHLQEMMEDNVKSHIEEERHLKKL